MSWSNLATFTLVLPVLIAGAMSYYGFAIDTKDTLSLFLSLVWGVFVALGGGFFFMSNIDFEKQKYHKNFMSIVSDKFRAVSIAILFHTALFVFLAFLFPIRRHIMSFVGDIVVQKYNLISLYDSLLYVEIVMPSIFSIMIGIWCILLVMNSKNY
jgi:hypothetical protein